MTTTRSYQASHPWISFSINLEQASPKLWALLGQALALCDQVAGAILPPSTTEKLYRTYLVKGARATTAIENNTLTEEQVDQALDGTLDLPPSRAYLGQEVRNTLDAYDDIRRQILGGRLPRLTRKWIADANRAVLKGLEEQLGEGVVPGETPAFQVGVSRYRAAPREDCGYLLDRLCRWLDEDDAPGPGTGVPEAGRPQADERTATATATPAPDGRIFQDARQRRMAQGILKATLAHLYIAWIHPYGDGNGRTARLVEFMLLARAGIPFPSAHLMSNHYNLTRNRYYHELDRSSRVVGRGRDADRGDVFGFVEYAVQGFVDGLVEQCRYVERAQMTLAWEHFVFHTLHQPKQTPATERRRRVAFALSLNDEPVQARHVPALTKALALAYTDKTYKTLTRDLDWLVKAGLIEQGPEGYRALKEQMKAYRGRQD